MRMPRRVYEEYKWKVRINSIWLRWYGGLKVERGRLKLVFIATSIIEKKKNEFIGGEGGGERRLT